MELERKGRDSENRSLEGQGTYWPRADGKQLTGVNVDQAPGLSARSRLEPRSSDSDQHSGNIRSPYTRLPRLCPNSSLEVL